MSSESVRCPASPLWIACAAVVGLLLLPPPRTARADDSAWLDLKYELLARRLLLADNALADLDLGVRVRNRVATLWGTVPSAELARHAVTRVKSMPELISVRSELFVDGSAPSRPKPAPAAPPHPGWQFRLPGRPQAVLTKGPATPVPKSPPVKWEPSPTGGEGSASQASTPSAVPVGSSPAAVAPPAVPQVPVAAEPTSAGIERAVRQLVQGRERYRRLRVEVVGERVFLSGSVRRWEDVHELSRAIARLPGVSGVTLRSIRAEPSGR
ncbi:MAG: BON domain-containing protein [Gemmataceae bacterium]|nr:BON domain-containing protein [Gemmataceae bacterium]